MAKSASPDYPRLETEEQKKALSSLKPTSGLSSEQFHSLILTQLQNISRAAIHKSRTSSVSLSRSSSAVAEHRVLNLKRLAASVQRMADQLKEGVGKLVKSDLSLMSVLPRPPVEELRSYAETLTVLANDDQRYVVRPTQRHETHPETREIIALVRFVEEQTGKPHWRCLAVLVAAALGVPAFNKDRLRKLVKYHE